jgi:hypothetical protein
VIGLNLEPTYIQTSTSKGRVPPEYEHDPDLYYAIQASLGEFENIGTGNDDLSGWD